MGELDPSQFFNGNVHTYKIQNRPIHFGLNHHLSSCFDLKKATLFIHNRDSSRDLESKMLSFKTRKGQGLPLSQACELKLKPTQQLGR
jgi:hypothetical protein